MSATIRAMSVAVLLAVAATTYTSAASAAAPAVDCMALVSSLSDCLTYVSDGSTTAKPEGGCCSGLKKVLKTSPGCLCEGFKQSAQFGLALNMTRALGLPSACRVHAPASATACAVSVSPAGAPVVAPAGSPFPSIANAPSYGPGSSGVAPAAAPSKPNSSSSISVSIHLIIVGIIAAFITSFYV